MPPTALITASRGAVASANEPCVWIVVVNYDGLADTQKCLRSLAGLSYPRCHVVLVDNASSEDPTPAIRTEFPACDLIRNPENGGWAGGNNTGIRHALERGADYVLLLNNDTTVAPDLVDRLVTAATARPHFGVLGPIIRFMDDPDEVMTDGCKFNDARVPGFLQRLPVPLQRHEPPAVASVDIVNGCCMMVAASVLRRVGLIDERFFLVHEESDLCLRVKRGGHGCGVLGEALVWHKGSSAFRRTGKKLQRYYDARNLLLLLRKHPRLRPEQRGWLSSRFEYVKYAYYRYAIEREAGLTDAADAVLQGVHDAMTGCFGAFGSRRRPAMPLLRLLFEGYRQWRTGAAPVKEEASCAASVR